MKRFALVALVFALVVVSSCSTAQDIAPTTTTSTPPTTAASPVASPDSVATAFMDALAEHNENAAREVVDSDGSYDFDQSNPPGVFDWERAVGSDYLNQGCEVRSSSSDGTLVDCPFLKENDWM